MRLIPTAGAAVVMTAASLFTYAEEPTGTESLRQSQGELLLQIEQLRQETQALRGSNVRGSKDSVFGFGSTAG